MSEVQRIKFTSLTLAGHYFLKLLEEKGKLSKCFTQNVDGLERLAGLTVSQHGAFCRLEKMSFVATQLLKCTFLANAANSVEGAVAPSVLLGGRFSA